MKGHDLGKDCLASGSAYRAVPSRETLPGPEADHYELSKLQDAFETAARAEGGLSLDGSNAADAKELEDEVGRSKYHHSVCVLKPIRSTSKYQHPVDNAGLFSFMTFNWLTSLVVLAHKKGQLFLEDIWAVSQFESCEVNHRRLAGLWDEEVRSRGDGASLRRVVWLFCRTRLLLSILCLMVTQLAGFSGPAFVVRRLLEYTQMSEPDLPYGLLLVLGLLATELIRSWSLALTWALNYRTGTRLRGAILTMAFHKILRLRSLREKSMGELINMCSSDGQRMFEAAAVGSLLAGGPLVAVLGMAYNLSVLGPTSLLGSAVFILFYPTMMFSSRLTAYFRRKGVAVTDQRVQKMNEILNYIKFIKMYAWVKAFSQAVRRIRDEERQILERTGYFQSITVGVAPIVLVNDSSLLWPISMQMFLLIAFHLTGIRDEERQILERTGYFQSITVGVAPIVVVIASVATFSTHMLLGYDLTAAQAFTVVTVFNSMTFALKVTPFSVKSLSEASVAIDRFKSLLVMAEVKMIRELPRNPSVAIEMTSASLAWETGGHSAQPSPRSTPYVGLGMRGCRKKRRQCDDPKHHGMLEEETHGQLLNDVSVDVASSPEDQTLQVPTISQRLQRTLHCIDLTIQKGKLVGVCGSVGSGKTSLISAILGQMTLLEGTVAVNGDFAYVAQQAWILNASFRDNILFGKEMEEERYQAILSACCLRLDLAILPNADLTEIGERGANLSGGQRQRISLARALYSNGDIYILDDPLSALDAHVGNHIFNNAIRKHLRGKTVIFVTHQLQYLVDCDDVIVMRDGSITEQGSHEDLMNVNGDYAAMFNNLQLGETPIIEVPNKNSGSSLKKPLENKKAGSVKKEKLAKQGDGQLMQVEERGKGSVPWAVYKVYIQALGGWLVFLFILALFVLNVGSTAFSNWWLSYWINQGSGNTTVQVGNSSVLSESMRDNPLMQHYAAVYTMSMGIMLLLKLLRGIVFVKGTMRASSRLHEELFQKILRSPMKFFDTTPTARILNRFSKDMDEGGTSFMVKIDKCVIKRKTINLPSYLSSGKSSLGVVLYRLVEPCGGSIKIDGVNICDIGLADLRSKLSIIPQEPVLFSGTVRSNLDPFNLYSEEQIWDALERTHMKECVSQLPLKLESEVVENGENFSVGERQLLCVARVLLRQCKILILDEATAAMDTETDCLIQETIRNAFQDCTTLTIAHRLHTVLSCDRIMVLNQGQVVEFDEPSKLLANENSRFCAMLAAVENKISVRG
ncbi:ATP-binding cassette sub-family C member 5 [Sinocyclocheilus grahami]|uniref:ATP-binding cassette sub-family C member 5 n=1 Tax=Sinocyclocheilus grahami TaxID=75366 RepID=UPI0007ACF81F|nr:PREDICTED: multidrug resistance-associated protein 5-like [Sinocyclocheilus grahami]